MIGFLQSFATEKTATLSVKGATCTYNTGSSDTFGSSNITTNSTKNFSLIKFGNDAPIQLEPGLGSNASSNYPSYYANDYTLRLYANNVVKIVATNENYSLKTIVFSYAKGSTVAVSTGSVSFDTTNKKCTWTAAENSVVADFTLTATAAFNFTSVEVTYDDGEGGELGDISGSFANGSTTITNGTSYVVDEGIEFSFTAQYAESIEIKAGDAEAVTFSSKSATWTPSVMSATNVVVTAKKGDVSKTLSFNLTVKEVAIFVDKLTNTSFNHSTSGYDIKSYTSPTSGISYTAVFSASNSAINFNSNSTNGKGSELVVTSNPQGYIVKSIDIDFVNTTGSGYGINAYAQTKNYTAVSDKTKTPTPEGTKLGTIGTGTNMVSPLSVPQEKAYTACGLYPAKSSATAMSSITITWIKKEKLDVKLSWGTETAEAVVGKKMTDAPKLTVDIEDAAGAVIYRSDNDEVATVDSNGIVTAKAIGTATITASISGNSTYNDASASYKLTVKPELGVIFAKTSAGVAFEDNAEVSIYDGTSLSFAADNAEQIAIYDESGDEAILINSVDDNNCEWTPSQTELQMVTVVATCGNTQKQEFSFYLTVNEPLEGLGEIIGATPENTAIKSDDEITITEGEKLVFSAENATKIEVFDYNESTKLAEAEGAKLEWTPDVTELQIVRVIATLENETKELAFSLTVTPLEVGNIVAKCDGETFSGKTFTCEVGSTLTFSAENALHITVQSDEMVDDDFKVLAQADDDAVSYQCDATVTNQEIYVTAYRYTDTSSTNSAYTFKLTVIPTLERRDAWMLVTSADELVAGQEYLICAASSDQAISTTQNGSNRSATDVTITDNTISAISADVQVITLSESTSVAGAFNLGVGLDANGNQQYLYAAGNASASSKDNKLGTTTNVSDLTAATITVGETISIEYTKATNNTGKYMYYNTNKSGSTSNPIFSCYVNKQTNANFELLRIFKHQTIAIPTTPTYGDTTSSDNKKQLTFVSAVGDLYTIETEYDSNGQEVTSDASEVRSLVARKAAADEWQYAAAQGETYTVAAPTTAGNYIQIQAKSVYNGISSDVTTVNLSVDGPISGIEGIAADSQNAPVEYYTLQGVRVNNPGTGLYIRRQGTNVEKVAIR
jgi:tellurite resistance protein